jgi:hypothetical protein
MSLTDWLFRRNRDRQLATELEFHIGSRTRDLVKWASRRPKLEGAPISNSEARIA